MQVHLRQSRKKRLSDLFWYLAFWEWVDKSQHALSLLSMRALVPTSDELQPHLSFLQHWVALQSLKALMLSIIFVWDSMNRFVAHCSWCSDTDSNGILKQRSGLIECLITRIFVTAEFLNRLRLYNKASQIRTNGIEDQVIIYVREHSMMVMTVLYMCHLALDQELGVLTILMRVSDILTRSYWLKTTKWYLNWATRWLPSISHPCSLGEVHRSGWIAQW